MVIDVWRNMHQKLDDGSKKYPDIKRLKRKFEELPRTAESTKQFVDTWGIKSRMSKTDWEDLAKKWHSFEHAFYDFLFV